MNPFSPTLGASYLGAHGAGKTVILNAVEDIARSQGSLTISDDAFAHHTAREWLRTKTAD